MADQSKSNQGAPPGALPQIPMDPSTRLDAWWWLVAIVVGLVLIMVIFWPKPYLDIIEFVLDGIAVSISVTVSSFVLVLFAGLLGGLGRLSKNPIVYGIATLYVELIRGIPLLVQLIWWYFAFPVLMQNLGDSLNIEFLARYQANPIAMAIIGMVFCYGAYMSEIYRAGIQSIPKGQTEAARSLGMNYIQSMRYVILPQAVRVILPPVGNEFIALLKDSSLVSVVAVTDLTRRAREYMSTHFNPIETWNLVALLYLVMTLLSARVVGALERQTRIER